MKAILEFEDEEKHEFEDAVNGYKFKLILWDLDQHLREKLKYGDCKEDEYDAYDKIREMLYDLLADYGVSLD